MKTLTFADLDQRTLTIDERFAAFHMLNPEVFRLFTDYAEEARDAGLERCSADLILHQIRWWHNVTQRLGKFKINDHFSSRYARLLIEKDPSFEGFFETRKLRKDA